MRERGRVIIIPNEKKIKEECFEQEIVMNHLEALDEFVRKYRLPYHFTEGDYQKAPIDIAKDGHMIIKTVEDQGIAIFYLPNRVTNRQMDWLENNKFLFFKDNLIGAYVIDENEEEPDQISGLLEIIQEAKRKNKKYRKEEEENVRKEI